MINEAGIHYLRIEPAHLTDPVPAELPHSEGASWMYWYDDAAGDEAPQRLVADNADFWFPTLRFGRQLNERELEVAAAAPGVRLYTPEEFTAEMT